MADAAVSFAVEHVGTLLIDEGKFLSGVRDQVEEMQIELEWMQCFLKDADRRKRESYRVRNWVAQIRQATYDVEDLVERFVLKTALRNRKGVMNRIKKYSSFISYAVELHQVGSKIEAIKAKLTNLRTRLQIYGIRELRVGGEESVVMRKRQDYTHVVDHNVIGLDQPTTDLVNRLTYGRETVICLYGIGGLGKTTFAKKVYTDGRIKARFECFAWVYISQQFNKRQVWESILTQLSGKKKEQVGEMTDDVLTSQLCDLQKEKKCFLVIDDIWSNQDWEKLSVAFPYMDENGKSKILLSTRNQNVVSEGQRVYHTSLQILDHSHCLKLLKDTILLLAGPNHPIREISSIEKIAKDGMMDRMVKQCAGLPLAIVVLGGILATKHELAEWERVSAKIKSILRREGRKENDHGVANVLESSYEDLPYNLKSCFLYFSQYPEDAEIKTTELKQKWIGEGFISQSMEEGDETMEDIAEEYLNELLSRCMIQAGRKGYTGRVKTCRMHDMMRDLCIEKAKEEGFAHSFKAEVGNDLDKVSFRRLSIFFGKNYKLGRSILPSSHVETFPQLRSIGFYDTHKNIEAVKLIVKKLKFTRVLQITGNYWDLGDHIGNLIHLRCLIIRLPVVRRSIGNLRLLQTLNMLGCDAYMTIPDSIWGLEQLRHLYLPSRSGCESNKQRVGDFRNLQTLVNFPPKMFDLRQHLVKFACVRKLKVSENNGEKITEEASRQGIVFTRLQSVLLAGCPTVNLEAITRASPHLHKLSIFGRIMFPATCSSIWPINLTKLVLENSNMDESHMVSLAKLENLKLLFLHSNAFIGKEFIFHRNDFPQLTHLKLRHLWNLERWVIHEGALPRLSSLEMLDLRSLKSVPKGTQFLKQLKLKDLQVEHMRDSFMESMPHWGRVSDVPPISCTICDTEPDREKAEDAHVSIAVFGYRFYYFCIFCIVFCFYQIIIVHYTSRSK